MNNHLVMRSSVLAFMNIQKDPLQLPRYSLIGDGFTRLVNNKAPTEYTRKFVNQRTETTDIIKYQTEILYEIDVLSNNEVIRRILDITDGEWRTGAAMTDVVTVWTDEIVARPMVCAASRRQYKIIPTTIGDDIQTLRTTGKMVAQGEAEKGFFDVQSGKFKSESLYAGRSIAYFNRALFNRGCIARKEY